MKYKLLALDIDGTLIGRDEVVSPGVVDALGELQAKGMRICLATGRAYNAAMPIWRQLRLTQPAEPLVVLGGSLVSEAATGRTLYQRPIEPRTAIEYGEAIAQAGYCLAAAYDRWRCGLDYFRTIGGQGEEILRRWMEKQDVNVRTGERLVNHEQLPGPLRMSVIASPQAAGALVDKLRVQFDGRLNVCSLYVPAYDFTVVESLAASASKLNGVMYVAQAWRIGRGGIVAIGDDMNDLAMVQGAALGVAMSTAPQALRDAANYVIPDGLAGFLHELAAGRFD